MVLLRERVDPSLSTVDPIYCWSILCMSTFIIFPLLVNVLMNKHRNQIQKQKE